MIDNFRGEAINPFKDQLDEIHGKIHDIMRGYHIPSQIADVYVDLHSILHLMEKMGQKMGELSREIHDIKNRSQTE